MLPALDGQYTAFGRVVEGLDVIEMIEAAAARLPWRGSKSAESP